MARKIKIPNPLDYVDGVALGKHLRDGGTAKVKQPKVYNGPPINIDRVARAKRKGAAKYNKGRMPG